jgi:hypothetical protein
VFVNVGCFIAAVVFGLKVHWKDKQPSFQFCLALSMFTLFTLWWLTGVWLHVDFALNPLSGPIPYTKAHRFAFGSFGFGLYGLYLFVAGKARARD